MTRFISFVLDHWFIIVCILAVFACLPVPGLASLAGFLLAMLILVPAAACVMGVLCGDTGAALTLYAGVILTFAAIIMRLVAGEPPTP